MKKDEAKRRVLNLFRAWAEERGEPLPYDNPGGGLLFYNWLENNHPHVLSFRSPGDKWQIVRGWLLRAGLVR